MLINNLNFYHFLQFTVGKPGLITIWFFFLLTFPCTSWRYLTFDSFLVPSFCKDYLLYCPGFQLTSPKIQPKKLSLLLSFYFHVMLERLKTFIKTNFRFKRVLCFAIQNAWISRLLRDASFGWRPGKLLSIARNRGHFAPVINCQRNLIFKWR